MEEDIKVLEAIQKQKPYIVWVDNKPYNKKQAIENLIKRNKELESELQHKNDQLFLGDTQWEKYIDKNYIPKSKVREKIENYKWASEGYDSDTADYGQSQAIGAYIALIELLQEGDK